MDKGEVLQRGFTVRPGQNGSFILHVGDPDRERFIPITYGFTTAQDLLDFIREEIDALKSVDGSVVPDGHRGLTAYPNGFPPPASKTSEPEAS